MLQKMIILLLLIPSLCFSAAGINNADTVKIHPIGDSITRGKAGDVWRHYLKTRLKNEAGIAIDFLGHCPHAADGLAVWADNPELFNKLEGDIEHDGWGGLKIGEITDMTNNTREYPKITIETMVSDYDSDIILLMMGTNDLISRYLLDTAPARLDTLIRKILNSTSAHLIVTSIPPAPSLPQSNGRISTFNAAIPAIIDAYKTAGKNISYIDINSYLGDGDFLDDAYHPNSQGNKKIADGWYDAITPLVSGVEENANGGNVPERFELMQNYPNPFNPTTTISYSLAKSGYVSLKIYDMLGKEVLGLVGEEQNAGNYEVNFNAAELSSGMYLYQLNVGSNFLSVKKMVLLK